MRIIEPPERQEYAENEPSLYRLIPQDGLLLNHMAGNLHHTEHFLLSLPEEMLQYRYTEDKWTIKEIVAHVIDMERIYSFRMLSFARNDQSPQPSFNDREYVKQSNANSRSMQHLCEELRAMRQSTINLLLGFTEDALKRGGAVNNSFVSVRALAYHIAGHELHHVNVIKKKYAGHWLNDKAEAMAPEKYSRMLIWEIRGIS